MSNFLIFHSRLWRPPNGAPRWVKPIWGHPPGQAAQRPDGGARARRRGRRASLLGETRASSAPGLVRVAAWAPPLRSSGAAPTLTRWQGYWAARPARRAALASASEPAQTSV